MHINSRTKFQLPLWITSWNMKGFKNPRWRRGCAHAPEPPSGKNLNTIEAPNHIYSRTKFQLFNSITSWDMDIGQESFICHWFNTVGPSEMGFLGFSTRSGFLMSSGFLGIFWLNMTKSGFLRHCGFSPHFISSLLTTLNLMVLKLPLWWYLFCYYFIYFVQLPHFHCGTEIQLIRND